MILLTSYERMRRYLANADGTALTDTPARKQLITNLITAASKQIEKFLNRDIEITNKTEYFDVNSEKEIEYFAAAYPISELTDVYIDSTGLWNGSNESELDDCYIGTKNDSIVLPVQPPIVGRKALRARYKGGLAHDGVKTLFNVSNVVGTWTSGEFIKGESSFAVGLIRNLSATALSVENLYGIFEDAETLNAYTSESMTATIGFSATVDEVAEVSLAESYPDIVRACEMQVRYMFKHKDDVELTGTNRDSTNSRREGNDAPARSGGLTREAIGLLLPYRKVNL